MPKIFISYRREDSKHAVGRLHSALKRHVRNPKRDIFMDIDNIPRGVDFIEHLDGQVAQCDIMLAVIGPGWLSAKDGKTGKRRLDDPGDFVRIEVASALRRGIPVVPVMLDDTQIPTASDLPDDLKSLARRNGERLDHESFDADVTRLIKNLPNNAPKGAPRPPAAAKRAASARAGGASWIGTFVAVGLLAIVGGAWAWFGNPGDWRGLGAVGVAELKNPNVATARSVSALRADPPLPAKPTEGAAARARVPAVRGDGETFRDCSDCPLMVAIPAGSFMMGSSANEAGRDGDEGPQRRVTVRAFAAGKTEVTWAEWERCGSAGVCPTLVPDGFGGGTRPVTHVSWNDAVTYMKWLSREAGQPYRLLSEAEWEYAARADSSSAYPWGQTASHQHANYGTDNFHGIASGRDSWVNTSPAGSFDANAFGLNDMHGNLWEWVKDCYEKSYALGQPSDGSAYAEGFCSYRVSRGGSWTDNPANIRSASRNKDEPTYSGGHIGFRVARAL